MSRGILSGARGVAGVALAFVIAWALVAVVLLTGTLVAAHQISRDVNVINPRISGILMNTGNIRLAEETRRLTAGILTAAMPLTGDLAGTLNDANSINNTGSLILSRAQEINSKVTSIHGTILSIGSTVASIGGNVAGITSSVNGIHASVSHVGTDVRTILHDVTGIHASVDGVLGNVQGINTTADAIVPQVNMINANVVSVQNVATPIGADLGNVLGDVGNVDTHANAIDCSALLNASGGSLQGILAGLLGGPTTGCNKS